MADVPHMSNRILGPPIGTSFDPDQSGAMTTVQAMALFMLVP